MSLSKLLEHDINTLGTFSLTMVLELVKPTQLSSQENYTKIFLYAKSMWMI
jgi:hypothetical protein